MKKTLKKLTAVMLAFCLLFLVGCTTEAEEEETTETTTEAILDLEGSWEEADTSGEYQAAYIDRSEKRIEVYWVEEDGTVELYWHGTYDRPKEDVTTYEWESEIKRSVKIEFGDRTSTAETKTFTYDNGVLSYTVDIDGEAKTYELVPTDTDYSIYWFEQD